MGQIYRQLSSEERVELAFLRREGCSIRQVAAALDRSASTIAREVKRNSSRQCGYQPSYADQQSRARRWTGSKLERDAQLRDQVLGGLKRGWSPEQVSGRLAVERSQRVISHETIYRFIYAQMARHKDYTWRNYLPRRKWRRGWRGRRGGGSHTFISDRRTLTDRPREVATRAVPGHWEADLMLFAKYGQAVLTLHERHTRLLVALRPSGKEAAPIADLIGRTLEPLPAAWRQTVTFDNGTEFARHYLLHALGIETFFCDPYAPWQKGGIENAIGRMRRLLPRKTDLATVTDAQFEQLIQIYNNTPRKCLDYRTPAELFWEKVLHFKCESTFLLPQE